MDKQIKLKELIAQLKGKQLIKTQKELAEKIQFDKTNLSSAINGNESYLTDGLFEKIYSVFPELKDPKVENSPAKVTYNKNAGRPFYDVDFTLGFEGVDNDITLNPEFNIDFPPANRDSVNWFRGKGNSMLGEINSGDYIALEEVEDFTWFPLGRIYGIVTKNGFRTIKRIVKSNDKNEYLLVSSNPDKLNHPDQPLPKNMISQLYKVVFVIKDLDE
ncbi:MAG TPA: S24 family peptidase [Flavobacterium sp.]|nr:S24 family peptidase [Flavobacterium sp.]